MTRQSCSACTLYSGRLAILMDDQVPLGLGQRTLGSTTVTVDVQSYQLVFPNGRSEFLLQSPLSHDGPHGGKLLVRQERGARNNEVSFRDPQQLSRVESPPCSTYVHGIILKPPHEGNSRDGDAVWLSDEHWEPGSQIKQHEIRVVNLRTWERLTVSLEDVCWVPKYRKLDRGEGEEELLTVSGPPVRSTSNKLTYLLAIVQRLRGDNYTASTSDDGPRLEVKEIVEQEQFKYQNLNKLPDGTKRIKEHFERLLHDHASNQVPTTNPIRPRLREAISRTVSGLVTPPSEYIDCYDDEAEDSEFERDAEMLTRAGMANLTRAPNPVVPVRIPRRGLSSFLRRNGFADWLKKNTKNLSKPAIFQRTNALPHRAPSSSPATPVPLSPSPSQGTTTFSTTNAPSARRTRSIAYLPTPVRANASSRPRSGIRAARHTSTH